MYFFPTNHTDLYYFITDIKQSKYLVCLQIFKSCVTWSTPIRSLYLWWLIYESILNVCLRSYYFWAAVNMVKEEAKFSCWIPMYIGKKTFELNNFYIYNFHQQMKGKYLNLIHESNIYFWTNYYYYCDKFLNGIINQNVFKLFFSFLARHAESIINKWKTLKQLSKC